MKKSILAFFFLLILGAARAQQDSVFKLIRVLPGDYAAFTADNLDNLYVLSKSGQVKKYNAAGDSMAVYNDLRSYGQASLIDVSNPLKVLLYYKEFGTVVMLDRYLNKVNSIDLRQNNILQAGAIAQSYDNRIWVYDEYENKLKKIDENGKLLLETPDFRLLTGSAPAPVKMFDQDRLVYLYDSTFGVYVFDYYGAQKNNILISHWKNFKVAGKFIYGSRGDTLYRYDIGSFMYDEWPLPAELRGSRSFNFSSNRLYARMPDGIRIYSLR